MKSSLLLVIASMGISSMSFSQIIYTNVDPDETYTADQRYYLDMDGDFTDEYIIEQVDSVIAGNTLEGVQLRSVSSVDEAVYEIGSLTFLASIPNMDLIDNNMNWTVPTPSLPAGGIIMIGMSSIPAGDWADGLEHYAALRFTLGSNVHFGWVRFTVATDGLSFTIMDYAYHSTPDQPLLAGATVDGVDENEFSEFSLQQAGSSILIQNKVSYNNTIQVFDISGKLIKTESMISSLWMDLSTVENGIYIIRCSNENGVSEFKLGITK